MTNNIHKALIIDDEEALREIVAEVLSLLEIETIVAEDGIEAIKLASEQKDSIDLFLIDMFMPNMSGEETYKKLNKMIPDCPVIFMSGYEKDSEAIGLDEKVKINFLKKPFAIADLKDLVLSLD